MQIPILTGIYADENSDFRTAYPENLEPVASDTGISPGYLRPAPGVSYLPTTDAGPGIDRGAINWDGVLYRVMGNYLCEVNGNGLIQRKDAFPSGTYLTGYDQVSMDYSFTHLAIASNRKLFLFDRISDVKQNTDSDLGDVLDVVYVDGYFMTTDGEYLVVTELGDPFAVAADKYGSSEVDPDPIIGLIKVHNEIYALNRHTIEAFYNKGTGVFPFARIEGSRMNRGLIGTHAKCEFQGAIAFLGSGRNEPPAVWVGANAEMQKLSTREIDKILAEYTEDELSKTVFEKRIDQNHEQIWIRLIDKILVYDAKTTITAQTPVWFIRDYGPKNLVWCYDKWMVGNDQAEVGYLDYTTMKLWGSDVSWQFQTKIIYAESKGAIFHKLELVSLPGRVPLGNDPTVWTSYSLDGEVWSNEKMISLGKQGERTKRICWFNQGHMDNFRMQKFRGNSDSLFTIARLEANIESLMY